MAAADPEQGESAFVTEAGIETPAFVLTASDQERWLLAQKTAAAALGRPPHTALVWHAARALYRSDIPTS